MSKIRVLIVDDAVVVRKLVGEVLRGDPDIEVVGTAPNGRIALAKVEQVNPDLLILDVEMPELDGLQTLELLRKTHPKLPVIMFSTLTLRGAAATLDALALGANDYVTKPAKASGMTQAMQQIRVELIPKIKALCGRLAVPAVPPVKAVGAARPRRSTTVEIIAIGVSTGGPNALAKVLPALPMDLPVPIIIVQHLPPIFTRLLAERLNSQSKIGVREAVAGDVLQPGMAWIAPGDYHMGVIRQGDDVVVQLHQSPPENSCRPAADVLFRSAAETFGGGALGVVLTGMGKDGLRGSGAICDAGGSVLVQDEASSVVWGMPRFVAEAGLADQVLPLERIASELVSRVRRSSIMIRQPVRSVLTMRSL